MARESNSEPQLFALLNQLGAQLDYYEDFFGAQRYHLEALDVARAKFAPNSEELGVAWHNLGVNHHLQQRYEDALDAYGKALRIWQAQQPVDSFKTALEYFCIGKAFESSSSSKISIEIAISSYERALRHADRGASRPSDRDWVKKEAAQHLAMLKDTLAMRARHEKLGAEAGKEMDEPSGPGKAISPAEQPAK